MLNLAGFISTNSLINVLLCVMLLSGVGHLTLYLSSRDIYLGILVGCTLYILVLMVQYIIVWLSYHNVLFSNPIYHMCEISIL